MLETLTDTSTPTRKFNLTALTIVLWLLSLVLGGYAIFAAPSITFWGILQFAEIIDSSVAMRGMHVVSRWFIFIIGGVAWLAIAIGGGSYFPRHAGEERTWKLLGWTLGIPIVIILISLLI